MMVAVTAVMVESSAGVAAVDRGSLCKRIGIE